jgi:hypothetical protein
MKKKARTVNWCKAVNWCKVGNQQLVIIHLMLGMILRLREKFRELPQQAFVSKMAESRF